MDDNKRKLYDALSQEYDLGTFEQFESDIADAGKRRKLYDATIEEYDFGDFQAFETQLGFAQSPKVELQQQAVAEMKAMPTAQSEYLGKVGFKAPDAPVEDDIYKGEYGVYTRTRVPELTKEYASVEDAKADRPIVFEEPKPGELWEREKARKYPQGYDMKSLKEAGERPFAEAMKGARNRVRYDMETEKVDAMTAPFLEEYNKEREGRKAAVENDVKELAEPGFAAFLRNENDDSFAREKAVRNYAEREYKADDLEMIEEFAADMKKRILAEGAQKAQAEENARALGMSVEEYVDKMVVPAVTEKMYGEWVAPEVEREKGSGLLGVKEAFNNSVFGLIANAGDNMTEQYVRGAASEHFQKNAPMMQKALVGAGSMFIDLPLFMGAGEIASIPTRAVGANVTKGLVKREAAKAMAKGVSKSAAERYANYAVRNGVKNRVLATIATAPLQSGMTFGMFDLGRDVLHSAISGDWDLARTAKSTAGGALMGAGLGVIGVPNVFTRGLSGGARVAAGTALFGAENAVFTEGGRLLQKWQGYEPESGWWEDYLQSGATLGIIKLPGVLKNVANIRGNKEASDVFSFNKVERELLSKYGKDMNAVIEAMLPRGEMRAEGERVSLDGVNEGMFGKEYARVMADETVPLITKAKLAGIVEGKTMPAPRVTEAKAVGNRVETYDFMGRLVDVKEYRNETAARAEVEKLQPAMEMNTLSVLEDMYVRIRGYEADDVTVREWLKANPEVKADDIARIVAKENAKDPQNPLTKKEQRILESLREARREGFNDPTRLNGVLAELETYGIDAKDVLSGVEKPIDKRTEAENRAVNGYRNILIREVQAELQRPRQRSGSAGMAEGKAEEAGTAIVLRSRESDRRIDETANEGMVYTTTTLGGEKIIITDGKVVLDNEGYIDANQSENLYAMFPDGAKKPVRLSDLREKVEVANAEELKAVKREEIRQEVAAENGWRAIEVGAEYDVVFDGDLYRVKVEDMDVNGDYVISAEGASYPIDEAFLQEAIKGAEAMRSGNVKGENEAEPVAEGEKGINAEKAESGDTLSPVGQAELPNETVQPQVELTPKQKREEVAKRIPMKGKERAWTEAEPADVVEYISLLTNDPAKQQAAVDKFIADIKAKQEKIDAITALEMDEDIAFWEGVKQRLAEKATPVAEVAPKKRVPLNALEIGEVAVERSEERNEEQRRVPLRARTQEWTGKLGVPIKVHESIETVTNREAKRRLENDDNIDGWFNVADGSVEIYLPNVEDVAQVDKVYLHEVVGHKGLRELMGEKYDALCDSAWSVMDSKAQKNFLEYVGAVDENGMVLENPSLKQMREAADEYMAWMAQNVDYETNKELWQPFIDSVREFFESLGMGATEGEKGASPFVMSDADIADLIKASYANLASKASVSSVTEAAENADDAPIMASVATERELQERIKAYAESKEGKKAGWTPEKVESITEETEALIGAIDAAMRGNEFYDAFADRQPTIRTDWRDGEAKPTVTWTRGNVEYKYDMSADLLCINNDGIEEVLSSPRMVELMASLPTKSVDGYDLSMTGDDYMTLYGIMREMGFVVPCKGCFDAAARFKMLPSVAQKFAADVNRIVDERNADPEAFDAKVRAMAKGEATVEGLPVSAKNKEQAIMIGVAGDKLTEHISWTQLMTDKGQTKMLADLGGVFRAWERTGAGRPKDKLQAEPYYGDIVSQMTTIIGKYGEKTPAYRDIQVNTGTGLRRNSHSEFRPVLAVDEIQFMRDAFIKGLTVFKYMKELDDVRLFGQMGVKYNMSFFPEHVKGAKVSGLDVNGDYIASEESVGAREFPYTVDGKKHYDGMKGWEEAQKMVNENVSLSSVVFSVPHLIKAMTDVPTVSDKSGLWGSLIPFHSSGATTGQLAAQGLGTARANGVGHSFEEAMYDYGKGVTNFEQVQNDRFGEGWVIVSGKKAGEAVEPGHKLEFVNGNHYYNEALGVHLFPSGYALDAEVPAKKRRELDNARTRGKYVHPFSVDYNEKVREIGSPTAYKEAADYYLEMLPKLGLVPRFQFEVDKATFLQMCADAKVDPKHPKLGWKGESWSPTDAESYYSLFCDYGMTDPKTGDWSPHRPVGFIDENGERVFRLPENAVEIAKNGLERYSEVRRRENAKVDEVIDRFEDAMREQGRLPEVDGEMDAEVRFSRVFGGNSGYVGYSMSKRAAEARAEGRFPKTDFKKEYGVTDKELKALVDAGIVSDREWHHTSMYGNKTTFYGFENKGAIDFFNENKDRVKEAVKNGTLNELAPEFKQAAEAFEDAEFEEAKRDHEEWLTERSLKEEYDKYINTLPVPEEFTASNGVRVVSNGSRKSNLWEYYRPDGSKMQESGKGYREFERFLESNQPSFEEWKAKRDAKQDVLELIQPFAKEKREEEDIRFRFIGKKGAENLDKTEEATTRLDNLNVAREMETGGKDAKTIKLATGWERGTDGKWRYETEDVKVNRGAQLFSLDSFERYPIAKSIEIGRVDENSTIKLADLLKDDELFKAYPEMEEYYVSFEEMNADTLGTHDFADKMIRINKDDIRSLESTLAHEIQHAIQHIEGFARGGSVKSVTTKAQALKSDVQPLYDMMLDTPEWAEKKRLVNKWLAEEDKTEPDRDSQAQLWERIEEINNSGVLNNIQQLQDRLIKKYGLDSTVTEIISGPYAMDAEVWNNLPESFYDRYETYRSLAGEVEARNVQRRMGYTMEQRRNSLAEETYMKDVAKEDQIFIYDSLGASAMERVDRDGNPIGDGSSHVGYKVDKVALSYPNITYKVEESATTESVYVTYYNNDPKYSENERPKVTVRYSNHDSNAVKFGDQLNGMTVERNNGELLYRLGLKDREWIPAPSVPTRTVSKKDLDNNVYEEADVTKAQLLSLPIGADISQYKDKLIKGTNELILVDKIVANNNVGHYRYKDIPGIEPTREGATENKTNFVSIYKTEDGKDINYTSERAEGYGVQGYGAESFDDGTGHSILQRQTDTGVPGGNSGLNAEKGEFCVVERVFTENGAFNFMSGEKIESADDVAYIFSALEDATREHSFVVYVKDGKPTVVELGMGSFNATMVDVPTASLAYSRINPDHVYFVHNHPSGNLICSNQDVDMLRVFENMSDVPVTGVIINLKTGKYGTFDTERHSAIGEKRVPENEKRLAVHTLDKQIFAPDYDPMAQPLVRDSRDVAQFLNSQRMGDRPKVSFLILSRVNRIVGNIHTPFTDITTDVDAVARYINERIIQFGGEKAILYGDFAISLDEGRSFRMLQSAMDRFGKTKLLDVVRVEGNFTKSANDLGLLYEPEAKYNVVKENRPEYNSPEQDIPLEEVKSQPLTFAEKITNSVLEASAKNKENLELRAKALQMYGRDVENLVKRVMGKQKRYDKSTVDQLVKLARMYFRNAQLLGEVSPYQVGRMMSALNNAVGKEDITDSANKLVGILVDAHNKALEGMLDKATKTKAKKVNASGVEVIGKLDKEGQMLLEEYNGGKMLDLEAIDGKIIDLQNEAAEGKAEEAAARIRGLVLARQYREEILSKMNEIKGLEQELKTAERDAEDGVMTEEVYKEFRRATERAIIESKLEMVDAYHGLIRGLTGDIAGAARRAKLFQLAQIDHVKEIQHNANSDLQGHPANAQGETPDKWNSAVPRLFMAAMPTFQTMLKFFGEKAADGRGYLYERFMPQHTQASHNEYIGKTEAREKMRDKLTEIFGKKTTIEEFMDMSRKDGAVLEYQEGGEMKTIDLTKGQVLYLYMIDKMADGQMKLSKMGITDADVLKMAGELPQEMLQFADWVQEELLTQLREKYNEVHERMFGAPMAAIESYFPIKINKRSRGEKVEPGMNAEDKPSTITGAVIKRTKNATAIDLSADAMQVLLGHVDEMENWAAWAEFRRDLKALLNYRHFQNQVKGMESIRFGSGEKLWRNFVDVANIAAGSFKPSSSAVDKAVRNFAKGVVSSKIAFRYFTALKQTLSTPAFWSEVDFDKMMHAYLHQKEAWDWAMENLPGFSKRWRGRAAGNEILLESDKDWKVWQNRAVQWLSKEGMRANAFIDALTVATGAKAVYETKYELFKKAGYSEERAREKALNRAAEAYNESQQSSESAYLSPLQAEATFASSVLTAFRNSPFGYNRKNFTAMANLKKKMRKGVEKEFVEYMTKQLVRDGLDDEQAKRFAESTYRRSKARDAADVALYGFFLNYIWVLGPSLIYLLGGKDKKKKKELLIEALLDGAMGGIGNLPAGESLTGAIKAVAEGDVAQFQLPQAVAMQDMETIADLMQTDPVRAAGEVLNILVAMGVGVNPQTFTDMFVALADVEDFSPDELAMLVMRLINAPNSKLELLEADKAMENYAENLEVITREYAEYQKHKRAPLTGWLYSDEGEQKAMERYEKRFKKILDERFEKVVEGTDEYDLFYENAEPLMREKLARLRKAYLEGDETVTFEKLEAEELVKKTLYGAGYKDVNTGYYELSTAEDEDAAYMIDKKLKELKPVYDEARRHDSEEFYNAHKEEIDLFVGLNNIKNDVNAIKKQLKVNPTEEAMNEIRRLRNEAIDLINHE